MNRTWEEKRGGVDARAAGVKAFPRQTTRVLVPPGLQDDSLFLYEIASVSSDFDKICCDRMIFEQEVMIFKQEVTIFMMHHDAS